MHDRINFLRERVRLQEAVLQSDKRLALFTSIGLGLFLIIFVGVVGYRYLLGNQIASVHAQSEAADTRLTSLKSIQDAYGRRKSMIALTNLVIEKRTKAWDAIRYLYTVIPTDSRIETINLSGTDGSLEFTVRAPSIFSYKNLSSVLQSQEVSNSGFSPQLGTLDRGKDGSYALQVRLFMKASSQPTTASNSGTAVQP